MYNRIALAAAACLIASCASYAPQYPPIDLQSAVLTISAPSVIANGNSTATVQLKVILGGGVPASGFSVVFSSPDHNCVFSPNSQTQTDANGIATASVSSVDLGNANITAQFSRGSGNPITANLVRVNFIFDPALAYAGTSTISTSGGTLVANGASSSTITLLVSNSDGLRLSSAPVTFIAPPGVTINPNTVTSDSNGLVTVTVTGTVSGPQQIIASLGGNQNVAVTVNFVPGPISSTGSTVATNSNLLTADGTSPATFTFTARDAYGNPIAGANVSVAQSGAGGTLAPTSGTTDASGVFIATLTSTTAGTTTVTATVTDPAGGGGNVVLSQSVTFLAGQPSTSTSSIVANPCTLTADGVTATTLTATVKDAHGNPISGASVTFSGSGTNNSFSNTVAQTDTTGQASVTLTSTLAQQEMVFASFAGGAVSTDVVFAAGAPTSSMTTLTASPTTVTADGTTTVTLTGTVRDAFGNPVYLQSVGLSSTGSNNTITPPSGSTDAAGQFSATLSSTTAEIKTVTLTASTATASASVTFTPAAPSSTTSTFAASPMSLTADGTSHSTLTVTVEDTHGNPVANQPVSITATGSNNTLSSGSGNTNSAGVFAVTLSSTKAEVKSLTATIGSFTLSASVTFVAGTPASATTTLTASPNTVTADNASHTSLTLTVLDAHGNPVAGQAVSLSSSGSNNAFGGTTGATNGSGVYTTTLASSKAESKTVTATVGTINATTTVTFVAGSGSTAHSSVTANPTSVTADGVTTTQLTVTIADAFNNPLANQSVTFTSTDTNNVFTPATGQTNSSGQLLATLSSTKAATVTVTATAGSAAPTVSVSFTPGALASVTFVANPNSLAADGATTTTLALSAFDAHGNAVPGQAVSLGASGTSNSFNPGSGTTDANGNFISTLSSTAVQTETITATVGTFTANANVTFTPPLINVTSSTVVASPNSLTADGTATTTITVTVLNSSNGPVTNAPVTMSATGINNTFSSPSGTTNSSGVFTTMLTSTQAGFKTVTATVYGTALNGNVTFLPGTPSGTMSTFVASPNTVTADGASTATLTLVVKDINGNAEPNQVVTFQSTGSNNILNPNTGHTDATGTLIATLASDKAESKTVTALVGGNALANTVVTFVPGTVNGAMSLLASSPNTTTANGVSTITFTVTAKDSLGNVVPGQSVVMSSTGTNSIFAPPSGSTNSSGVFVTSMTSTKAELKAVTATLGTVNENANVVFVPGPVSSPPSSFTITPSSVAANGNTAHLTVFVADANNNPIANQTVTLSGSGTANNFTPGTGTTNPNGVFTATLWSDVAQAENIFAFVGSFNLMAPITFTAGSPNSVTTSLTASSTSLVADGTTSTTLTLTVEDAMGNPVANQSVALATSGSNNTINPSSGAGTTNNSGVFTMTLASTKAEVKTITATVGGFNKSATVTFTAGSPSNANTTLVASPSTVAANGSTTSLTVTVADQYGNPIANQSVSLSATGTNNVFNPSSAAGSTNPSGVFTATLASTTAQTETVTAIVGSLTATASVTFMAGSPNSTMSFLTASPNSLADDGVATSTLQITVEDSAGNLVSGQAVTFSTTATNYVFSAPTCTTTAGMCSITMRSSVAQTATVSAAFAGLNETTTVIFWTGSPNQTTSSLSASPTSLAADNVTTTSLLVTIKDATGNGITGQAVTFSSNGTNQTFNATTCTTLSGQCSVTLRSSVAQTVTITAAAAGINETATVTFTAGGPSSVTSSLSANPNSLTANGVAASTIQISVSDATDNQISNQAVTFSSNGTGTVFSAPTCTTNALGLCSVTLKDTVAQTVTVTASFAGVNKTANVTFVAGPASNANSSLSASPPSVPDDNATFSTLQVSVADATGNPLSGQGVTFSSTGTGYTWSSTTCTTVSGICSVTLRSSVAQTVIVTATFAGLTKTTPVTFMVGAAASGTSFLTASPNSLADDGVTTSNIQISVADATGNPISGQAVTFSSTGAGIFSAPTCTTISGGVCAVTLRDTVAQTVTVTANFAGITKTANVTFVTGPISNANSTLVASPNSVQDDGVHTATLLVTVEDSTGNPINNQNVSFSAVGTGYTFSSNTCTTATGGQCSVILKDTVAETVTITATFAGYTKTASVIFTTGSPNTTTSTFIANPTTVTANGNTTTLTLTAKDATGNLLANMPVSLAATANDTISPANGNTNAVGTFTATWSSFLAGTRTVTATMNGGPSLTTTVTFVAGPPVATSPSTFVVSPNSLVAGNTASITLTLEDAYGNPVQSQAVTFTGSGSNNTFSPSTVVNTNSAGVATATVKSGTVQNETLTANFRGLSMNANIAFTAGLPVNSQSTLGPSPSSLTVGNPSMISLTAKDASGNPVANAAVTFTTDSNATVTPQVTFTNASGMATVSLNSNIAAVHSVVASSSGSLSLTTSVTYLAGSPAAPPMSTLLASPSTVATNANATLIATIRDSYGNPVPNTPVSISASGGTPTTPPQSGNTSASGTWVTTISYSTAQNVSVTATFAGWIATTNLAIVSPGSYSSLPNIAVPAGCTSIFAGEFTGDGNTDLLLGQSGNTVYLMPGVGNGNFTGPIGIPVQSQNFIAVDDFNKDGYMDFASVATGGGSVLLNINNHNNTFTPYSYDMGGGVGATYSSVATGDFAAANHNLDGIPDVVAAAQNSAGQYGAAYGITNAAGTGSTTATLVTYPSQAAGTYALGYDFTKDGNSELVVLSANNLYVYWNHTGSPGQFSLGSAANANAMVLGDFDGDSNQDIAFTSPSSLTVFYYGGGTFSSKTPSVTLSNQAMVSDDFNNDGISDLAASAPSNGAVVALGTTAQGTMSPLPNFNTSGQAQALAAGDFNRDGILDLAIINAGANTISILLVQAY